MGPSCGPSRQSSPVYTSPPRKNQCHGYSRESQNHPTGGSSGKFHFPPHLKNLIYCFIHKSTSTNAEILEDLYHPHKKALCCKRGWTWQCSDSCLPTAASIPVPGALRGSDPGHGTLDFLDMSIPCPQPSVSAF